MLLGCMDLLTLFALIAGIIIIGYFAELLFKKTHIPDVLLLIGVGIAIRFFFPIIDPLEFGMSATLFTTFALIYLLFQGALAIDFDSLFKSVKSASLLTIVSFVFTTLTASILSIILLGFSIPLALLFGMILGGTSSAVVIPLVKILPLQKKYGSSLILESAISDVLCIVGAMTLMNIILSGQITTEEVFKNLVSSFSLAIIIGAVAGLIWVFTIF